MPAHPALGHSVPPGQSLSAETVRQLVETGLPRERFAGQRVLLIIPDGTRTAPVGLLFKTVHQHLAGSSRALDILVALGTHQPMSEAAICERLEITLAERHSAYTSVRFFNHAWNDPSSLRHVGTLPASEIHDLTDGRFAMDVPVEVNRLLFDYDQILIIGPVFPHEVVGFSGGNKYLFPGVGGPQILNFFHWLAAVISTPRIIGNKWTAVRKVVDRAGAMVALPKTCLCAVVDGTALAGLFIGTPEDAWSAAADLSRDRHILYQDRPFHTIFACAPKMYDEIWTAGKCMYKLEPVLADGGELIIYAPHISELCVTHGRTILEVGYHCRDYFVKQWDRFKDKPWGVLAHSTHVHGLGAYENGVEQPRARVTLATAIPESICRQVNLGYRDPASLRPEAYAHRETEGILMVPKAGEILYRLKHPPAWAV